MDATVKSDQLSTHQEIVDCVAHYIESAVTGKSGPMRSVMHPDAQIVGYLDGELMDGPMQILYDYVDESEPAGDKLSWAVTSVEESNGAATARVVINDWHGYYFNDFFALVKHEGKWTIINKVFSQT